MFVLVAMSNAVNLTDGRWFGSWITHAQFYRIFNHSLCSRQFCDCWIFGNSICSNGWTCYYGFNFGGASLGFLWYNAYRRKFFMGDVGSLSLGAGLALMAIMAKQELLLPIAGGLFVLETVSVMMQVASFKYLGRRLFKMAPIHHHFELLGGQNQKLPCDLASSRWCSVCWLGNVEVAINNIL